MAASISMSSLWLRRKYCLRTARVNMRTYRTAYT